VKLGGLRKTLGATGVACDEAGERDARGHAEHSSSRAHRRSRHRFSTYVLTAIRMSLSSRHAPSRDPDSFAT
jgi:hypothetical protein